MTRLAGTMLFVLAAGLTGLAVGLHQGRAAVQARWDAETARQQAAAAAEQSRLDAAARGAQDAVTAIGDRYDETLLPTPGIADSVAADLGSGTLRVRYECAAPGADPVPGPAGRAGQLDAAAAAADENRREAAIASVRAGDDADARERQLREQVIALQAVLRAERGG